MKNVFLTIALFFIAVSFSEIKAQENTSVPEPVREPASQNVGSPGGYTQTEKLIQDYNDKTVITRTLEGFNKGMERTDPGSSAADYGTSLYKATESYTEKNQAKPAATTTSKKSATAVAQ